VGAIRPSLVLLDDPQTRQSAASLTQTRRRMELLNGDVLGMAGPGEQIAAVLTCTKIYDADLADQVLDREKNPEWDSECTKLVYAFPTNETLWDEYANVRRAEDHTAATDFYRRHRDAMDAGAVVAWAARYDARTEASAIRPPSEVGESSFAFDTSGGTQHITQSLGTIASYAASGTPPNFGGAVGVTHDSVEGVDITIPVYSFSETHFLDAAFVTPAYYGTLFNITGKVNNASFKGLAAGECLFLGASGSSGSRCCVSSSNISRLVLGW